MKNLIVFISLIITFSYCTNDSLTTKEQILAIEKGPESLVTEYNCAGDLSKVCFSEIGTGSCTRITLDPCDYSNMELYGRAVVKELNKQLNCPTPQGFPFGCETINKCAYLGPGPNPPFAARNPWLYCGYTINCNEYWCEDFGITNYFHVSLSPSDQDAMLALATGWANAPINKPECANYTQIRFKICYTNNGGFPFPCVPFNAGACTNMVISIQIIYYCCA